MAGEDLEREEEQDRERKEIRHSLSRQHLKIQQHCQYQQYQPSIPNIAKALEFYIWVGVWSREFMMVKTFILIC